MEDEDTAASRFLRSMDDETVDTPDDDSVEPVAVGASVAVGKSSAARPAEHSVSEPFGQSAVYGNS